MDITCKSEIKKGKLIGYKKLWNLRKVTELLLMLCLEKLENNHEILSTQLEIRKNRIRVLAGDNVMVEMTPWI